MNSFVYEIKNYLAQENIDIAMKLYDKFNKGSQTEDVTYDMLEPMLRLLDFNPTRTEVEEMKRLLYIKPEKKEDSKEPLEEPREIVTRNGLLVCMARMMRDSDTVDELIACFKLFDKENRGHLSEPVFRYVLSSLGDNFTDDEMDLTMKDCAQFIEVIGDVKYIDYVEYSKYLKDLEFKPKPKPEDDKKKQGKKN